MVLILVRGVHWSWNCNRILGMENHTDMKRSYAEMIVANLEAEEKLVARGWVRKNCETCNGTGVMKKTYPDGKFLETSCPKCQGVAYHWEPPIAKDLR